MNPIINFIRNKLIPFSFFLALIMFALSLLSPFVISSLNRINAIDKADKGYIVEKRYVPASSSLFFSMDTHYRIYVSVFYEKIGIYSELSETEKYFIVEKEVYDQYEVGDFFDSTKI